MPRQRRRSSGKAKKTIRPCTFELGYVRQDLYACRKCTQEANGRLSGFCAGCRNACHADHADEVFELYTKRSFRCDCGNKRARNTCKLQPDKDDFNVGNERTYSHNFESRYCRCDREYDYTLPMAQCAMCEDWFHEECYKTDSRQRGDETQPFSVEYEFTCKDCVKTLPVLSEYYETLHAWTGAENVRTWRDARLKKGCTRPKTANVSTKAGSIDLMWRPGFRIYLCRCADCSEIYRSAHALYITDRSDFVNVVDEDYMDLFIDKTDDDVIDEVDDGDDVTENKDVEVDNVMMMELKQTPKKRERSACDNDGTPTKLESEAIVVDGDVQSRTTSESVDTVRERIFKFLNESIDKNGEELDPKDMLSYVADLKTDLLATFWKKLDDNDSKS